MNDQTLSAFIGALLQEDVDPQAIALAVARVIDLRVGDDVTGPTDLNTPLRRAFVHEQAERLRKAL